MFTKRLLSLLLTVSILCTVTGTRSFATGYDDMNTHWAKVAVERWSDRGIIGGSGEDFRPDDKLTRGEMAVMIDRIMKYQVKADNTFTDLGQDCYADSMLKASAAGVIQGASGQIRPNDNITREEAAVMLGRALGLTETYTNEPKFADNKNVSYWADGYVNAMKARGYVNGSDGNFNPGAYITRAETVEILDSAIGDIDQKSGTYSGDIDKTLVVNAPDVTLENMTIKGDLILADGIGDGKVTLNNVTVEGNTVIRGGKDSVNISGACVLNAVTVLKIEGDADIAFEDGAQVGSLVIGRGSQNVTLSGKIPTLTVKAAESTVTAQNAQISTMYIEAGDSHFVAGENTKIDNILVKTAAIGTNIDVRKGAEVAFVKAAAENMQISGDGALTSVTVSGKNCDIQTTGTKALLAYETEGLKAGSGVTVTNQPAPGKLDIVKPNKLKPGDTIGVIAPCNGLKPTSIQTAIDTAIAQGYKLKLPENIFKFTNGYAATPQERADDFNDLIADDSVNAIFFGGGEVSNETLPYIDFEAAREHPKIICSYSDSTSLLDALYARSGIVTYYGSSFTRIFSNPKPYNYQCFEDMIVNGNVKTFTPNSEWKALRGGKADGVIIGGYLLNFALLQNTEYFPYDKDQKYILCIEENARFNLPSPASRYFSHIEQSGLLDHVTGILVGEYSTDDYPDYMAILQRLADKYQIPVVYCHDFGHGVNGAILPIGIHATLDADNLKLTFNENQTND
ncbi:MAG: S-layer homology domain-containing protein [Bacillota bacterium]|nr:S-layer homology domain-containing protein [Bacillota bacterium]